MSYHNFYKQTMSHCLHQINNKSLYLRRSEQELHNRIFVQRSDFNDTPMSHGRRERWIAVIAVFARGLSLDQIVGQQLAISLIPNGAPSGSEPFRRVLGRLRLAGQLVHRQNL